MKQIEQKEYKKIITDILRYIDEICEKNNIKYSLIGGSLIGAVRSNGIIPWDDDIDITLMPKDYDKLVNILKKEHGKYKLINFDTDSNYYLPYSKLINTDTYIIESGWKEISNYGAFVDIFKLTYLPNNKIEREKYLLKYYNMLSIIHGFSKIEKEKNYLKRVRTIFSKHLNVNKYLKKFDRYTRKYDNTDYVISNWPIYGKNKEIINSNNMYTFNKVKFENISAMITVSYDEILKNIFGNYMELPPEDKRISHNIMAFWKSNELVSCIITTYNRPIHILKRAIDSVLNQAYKNIELIIVNDYPENEELSQKIKKLIDSYDFNIKFINLKRNSGACYARNVGAKESRGNYIAFLDDDDEWLSSKIEEQLKLFTSDNISLVYCDSYLVKNDRKKIHKQINPNAYNNNFKQILEGNFIGGVSFPLIRKKCFSDVGGFDVNLPSQQDTDLWIRLIKKYDIAYCNKPLLNYFISNISITSNIEKKKKGYDYILKKYEKDYLQYQDVYAKKLNTIGNVFTSFGETKIANYYYSRARKMGTSKMTLFKGKMKSIARLLKKKIYKI